MYTWNDGAYLMHHGIKGQRWGVRRFQNEDGSLTEAGKERYRKYIEKAEKKARKDAYKQRRHNGGSWLFPSARTSTGKNYDSVLNAFEKSVYSDKKYNELSKKAVEAEKKRMLAEKKYYDNDQMYSKEYDRWLNSKKYTNLWEASRKATEAKNERVKALAKKYEDRMKDAKLDDMQIKQYRDIAKQFLSGYIDTSNVWDHNIEFNPDAYYEPGWDDTVYRRPRI